MVTQAVGRRLEDVEPRQTKLCNAIAERASTTNRYICYTQIGQSCTAEHDERKTSRDHISIPGVALDACNGR